MGVLKIHCDYCGGSWEAYPQQGAPKARYCPHCGQAIDRQLWDKFILPAFGELDDANRELFKHSTGYHTPLFQVDYEADTIFKNALQTQKDEE